LDTAFVGLIYQEQAETKIREKNRGVGVIHNLCYGQNYL